MTIKVDCDKCKAVFNVNDKLAGKKGKCPKCHNPLEVPFVSNDLDFTFSSEEGETKTDNNDSITKEGINDSNNEETQVVSEIIDKTEKSGDESDSKTKNNGTEVVKKKKKGKGIRFILFTILFSITAIGGYGYYLYQANPDDNIIVNSELYRTYIYDNSELDNNTNNTTIKVNSKQLSKNNDLNFSFNLKSNYEYNKGEETIGKGFFNIDDAKIISKDGALKQQIKLTKVSGQNTYEGDKSQFIVENIDFVSDYEKLYFYIGKGYELIFNETSTYNVLKSGKASKDTLSEVKNIFKDEEYVMIDNGKAMLNALGDASGNKLLRGIVTGMATSNPMSYYINKGVEKEIKNYISRDRLLFYLLVKSDDNKYEVNVNICDDISPILSNVTIAGINNYGIDEENIRDNCNQNIGYINNLLSYFDNIRITGDQEKGNFKMSFLKGEKEIINLVYKNHIIDLWSIDFDNQDLLLNINGNKDSVLSSNIKIDTELSGTRINGEIKDGEGDIFIKGNDISSTMNIKEYYVNSYDFSYKNSGLEINSNYKEGMFSFDVYSTDSGMQGKFSYDNGKINGFVKVGFMLNYVFNGEFNSFENFDFVIVDDNLGNQITIDAKQNGETTDYRFSSKLKGLETSSGLAILTKTNGEEETITYNVDGNIKYASANELNTFSTDTELENSKVKLFDEIDSPEVSSDKVIESPEGFKEEEKPVSAELKTTITEIELDNIVDFNISFDYKLGGEEQIIPENFKEVEINTSEIIIMPDLSGYTGIDKRTIMMLGGVGVGGTLAVIGLQGYGEDVDNSKSISDINNIITLLEMEMANGTSLSKMVVNNKEYKGENIVIGGKKLVFGQNYFVGTLNYEFLGIDKKDYLTPDGGEYIVGVSTVRDESYQILSEVISGGGINEYKIIGNYNPIGFKVLRKGDDYTIDEPKEGELSNSITLTSDINIGIIRKGDIVGGKEVIKVSSDGKNITFDKVIKSSSLLLKPDTKGLIFVNGKMIEDGDIVE